MAPQVEVCNHTFPRRSFGTAKPGDVGHDLYVHVHREMQTWLDRLVSVLLGQPVYVLVPVAGVRLLSSMIWISMPPDVWCRIRARSSTARRKLQVLGGTIDSGYQGELFTHLHNFGFRPRVIRHGERYAQVVFHRAVRPEFKEVVVFSEVSVRADSGFGSTGS